MIEEIGEIFEGSTKITATVWLAKCSNRNQQSFGRRSGRLPRSMNANDRMMYNIWKAHVERME